MSAGFSYLDGQLHADRVPLAEIAAAVGTPAYIYAGAVMRERLRQFLAAFAGQRVMVCYALKANSNLAVVRTLAARAPARTSCPRRVAAGARGRRAATAHRILRRRQEPRGDGAGARCRHRPVQCRIEPEPIALGEVAAARRLRAPVALRVNPDVGADTHDKISTGRRHDKVRHRLRSGARGVRDGASAGRDRGDRPASAHRLADREPGAVRGGLPAWHRAGAGAGAAGIALRRLDLGGGFGVAYRAEPPLDLGAYAR